MLPYPPPKPFIPLNSHKLDSQIGLLRGYYRSRFDKVRESAAIAPPIPALPVPAPPTINATGAAPSAMQVDPLQPAPTFDYNTSPPTSLPDDTPSSLRMKMGPIGQVSIPSAAAASAASKKKKAPTGSTTATATALGDPSTPKLGGGMSPTKTTGTTATKTTAKKKPSKASPKKQPTNGGPGPGGMPPQAPPILAS